ncbi:MAG TPA: Rrf2 family transcriptional regulator [Candidatus Hydrogenedens sp.]|nr:Rrf2 family transcriptional regulator [Candidatus Hydrogenedens sp.]HOL20151.1 Rrf2 family transcriptional regulator [Candidatus Hydrogenedens sp.]HPP58573.1 Rrf2 family transcriptional regulator [Candidatus Hydrogenedens sp.]
MFSKTTITAIQALAYIAIHQKEKPVSHIELTKYIPVSTSYLSKIMTLLTKARFLNAHRGPSGGFMLSVPPDQITLLEIVETCEGKILGDYCKDTDDLDHVCAFHKAMYQVRSSLIYTLKSWTLEKIIQKPLPDGQLANIPNCKMKCVYPNHLHQKRMSIHKKINKS